MDNKTTRQKSKFSLRASDRTTSAVSGHPRVGWLMESCTNGEQKSSVTRLGLGNRYGIVRHTLHILPLNKSPAAGKSIGLNGESPGGREGTCEDTPPPRHESRGRVSHDRTCRRPAKQASARTKQEPSVSDRDSLSSAVRKSEQTFYLVKALRTDAI